MTRRERVKYLGVALAGMTGPALAQECERVIDDPVVVQGTGGWFGQPLALSGTTLATADFNESVGLFASGEGYLFEFEGGDWVFADVVTDPIDPGVGFGERVDVNGDLAVFSYGCNSTGLIEHLVICERDAVDQKTWIQRDWLAAPPWTQCIRSIAVSGNLVAIAIHGNINLSGGDRASVQIYEWNPLSTPRFALVADLPAPSFWNTITWGFRLDLEGSILAFDYTDATTGASEVRVHERDHPTAGAWGLRSTLRGTDVDLFAGGIFPADLELSGGRLVAVDMGIPHPVSSIAAPGAAYVFERQADGSWIETAKVTAPDPAGQNGDRFAASASVDGDWMVISDITTPSSATLHLYAHDAVDGWQHQETIERYLTTAYHDVALGNGQVFAGSRTHPNSPSALTWYEIVCELSFEPYCGCNPATGCTSSSSNVGCDNSTGQGAELRWSGTSSVATDDLVLEAHSVPVNQPGIVYMGPAQTQVPFGGGYRCVDPGTGEVYRYPVRVSNGAGVLSEGPGIVGFSQGSFGIGGQIAAGQTWHFQAWFRDPSAPLACAFNLSNALSVTFMP